MASELETLAPTSAWTVDFAERSCALQRTFGNEARQVFLELRMFGPMEAMQVIVADSQTSELGRKHRLTFLPGSPQDGQATLLPMALGDGAKGFMSEITLKPGALDAAEEGVWEFEKPAWPDAFRAQREQEISGLMVEQAFASDVVLQTGEMHVAMETMRSCVDDLMRSWGVDAEQFRALRRRATPANRDRFVRAVQRSFPSRMLANGRVARLAIRLDVDADGTLTACHQQSEINDDAFEVAACQQLKRNARFLAAIDAEGYAVASIYQLSVVYHY